MKHILTTTLLSFLILYLNAQDTGKAIKDADGNTYTSVAIGDQTWLKENLNTTRFRNGDKIPTTVPVTLDITSENEAKYQWAYEGKESNAAVYGRLYTWYAVADERKICPEGWHVPAERDWNVLIEYLGGRVAAGGKLKETGTEHWAEPNKGATNESGFTALPGGGRLLDGTFRNYKRYGSWWASTPTTVGAFYAYILFDEPYTFKSYTYQSKYFGFSVRCIKD